MDTLHPIDVAASLVGSQVALAAHLGVSKAALNQWKLPARQVPAEHCPPIELITSGLVRCEMLRPDIAWGVLRKPAANDPQMTPSQTPDAPKEVNRVA